MGIDKSALFTEMGIENVDVAVLVEKANKANDRVTKANEALEAANEALAQAQAQPDRVAEATTLVETMEELGLEEKTIRSALRTKFGTKRAAQPDEGSDLTDAIKAEMMATVNASGHESFTTASLAAQYEVKRAQVAAWISDLVDSKEVEKVGIKRGTKYYLAGMAPAVEAEAEAA